MGSLVPFQYLINDPNPSTSFPPIQIKPEFFYEGSGSGLGSGLIPSSPPTQTGPNEENRVQEGSGDMDMLNSETGAIVPVQSEENRLSALGSAPPQSRQKRSNELVRVTNFIDNQRETVRRTRMLYDALRIYTIAEEKKLGLENGRRVRGDLKAATLMRDRGLWANIDKRIVGSIPGVYIGDFFFYRMELCVIGLHVQVQAGIDYLPASQSANGEPIATSIVLSGGYEDDEDEGDTLVYTGQGGHDNNSSKMAKHQKLEGGNLALERSQHYNIEIRVIRGVKYGGSLTSKVYVYDGLYKIIKNWTQVGKSGFDVCKYRLVRIEGQPEMGSTLLKYAQELTMRPLELRPEGYLTLDLSMKKENIPIFVFNDIDADQDPLYYDYLPRMVFPPFVYGGTNMGCNCVTSCTDGCLCAAKNGGEIAYDQNGFLVRGKPLIFECGSHCSCPPSCRNRVSQNGLKNRLEVFRSEEMGWGVRTLDLIPPGGFICEYTGVVLTRDQAQIFSMNGECLIYPGRFAQKWTEWGDLSPVYPDYATPTYPSIPPLDFAMDVSSMRNVACYISHSTCPNVMVQHVLYDHNNILFPHLMLFAMESIPAMRELCLDYGVADENTEKLAICN